MKNNLENNDEKWKKRRKKCRKIGEKMPNYVERKVLCDKLRSSPVLFKYKKITINLNFW